MMAGTGVCWRLRPLRCCKAGGPPITEPLQESHLEGGVRRQFSQQHAIGYMPSTTPLDLLRLHTAVLNQSSPETSKRCCDGKPQQGWQIVSKQFGELLCRGMLSIINFQGKFKTLPHHVCPVLQRQHWVRACVLQAA